MSETSSLIGGPAPAGSAITLYNHPSADYAAKVHATIELLKAAAIEHPGKVVQATSLGVEDMIVTDLIARHQLPIAIGTLETGMLHAETAALIGTIETHYADAGIHVLDDSLHGSDAIATSLVLAQALRDKGFDLIIFGSESTDARMSVVPAMVAERLGIAQMTFAQRVDVSGSTLTIDRATEYGFDTLTCELPAVVSVVEKINEPRYPSFKGIMAAKKKPVDSVTVASLGLDAAMVGASAAWSVVDNAALRPAKAAGVIVEDAGDGGVKIADFLTEQKFI